MLIEYFATPDDFRQWLAAHHDSDPELWVGFFTKGSGKANMTWPESVDEALCFGWIDGILKNVDAERYIIRFTPRRPGSIWSTVNIRKVENLSAQGRMQPAGLAAFAKRKEDKSGIYSHEQPGLDRLDEPYASRLNQNNAARAFFEAQAASYRKAAVWWVISAKQEGTRLKRLEQLITDSANGRTLAHLTRIKKVNPS